VLDQILGAEKKFPEGAPEAQKQLNSRSPTCSDAYARAGYQPGDRCHAEPQTAPKGDAMTSRSMATTHQISDESRAWAISNRDSSYR
jgi:hypothetical protein